MEQIVVKTEIQNNGEILLYYVDENGENQQGIVTTLANVDNSEGTIHENYILSNLEDFVDDSSLQDAEIEEPQTLSHWSEEDIKRLLIFYYDNKQSFSVSSIAQKNHLWSVACKTMLIGKDPDSCDMQLEELRSKYVEVCNYLKQNIFVKWPFLEICQKAFHDDVPLKRVNTEISKPKITVLKEENTKPPDNMMVTVKQINPRSADDSVIEMLNLYLKYKHNFQTEHWRKDLWETIASEMGESDDGEYWHKRFLNYKQHYINMLVKQKESGPNSIHWPYMDLFDKIFKDDDNFQNKYFQTINTDVKESSRSIIVDVPAESEDDWNTTYITVLGKYFLDSYEEFEDPTIPDMFLWTEVGRLIDKKPETCKAKYAELRDEHIESYVAGGYCLENRTAISIILDHIISKDVKKVFTEATNMETLEDWNTEDIDELVRFFHDYLDVFKDTVCYFVCWEAVASKLKRDIESCKRQWDELLSLYKSILADKKDDPDLEIDWRYIEMFDRIFDYGMDATFIKGYADSLNTEGGKVSVKRVTINTETEDAKTEKETVSDVSSPRTDPRSTKILEFYLKNKDKFQTMRNKLALWEPLAEEIDMNSTQCSHRFRHLKQLYIESVQKEINQPKANITWPYYTLCRKVFGYRTIKSKLKQGTLSAENDWLSRELKLLISFFSKNFNEINDNIDDVSKWEPLATELGKSQLSCKDKFVELRKCYRKLKTMKTRNPDVKISWTHFAMFDRIYKEREGPAAMEVDDMEEEHLEMDGLDMADVGEEDYECIIVLQEGQDLSDISDAQIIIKNTGTPNQTIQETEPVPETLPEQPPKVTWTKRTKKLLLIHYINYMRSHRGKKINQKQLWDDVSTKIPNKTHSQCKKMFIKLKKLYKNSDETEQKTNPLHSLMEKVLKIKPKLSITPIKDAKIQKTYKDVEMIPSKVESALTYYLNHIDDFIDPKFEKKFLWTELAQYISEPVNKVYNKINYLKQAYNVETQEINGQKTEWSGILNEIIAKEVSINVLLETKILSSTKPFFEEDETNWSEDLIESLLTWYLGNLDKFKNPKFNRSYLWMEVSAILNKSPLVCSKKMSEIRSQYRNMVKENAVELNNWKFLGLCQKIYGTGGKKISETDSSK